MMQRQDAAASLAHKNREVLYPSWGTLGEVPAPSEKRGAAESMQRAEEGSPPAPSWGTGSDSHIHQLGRLVHPHGKAILALRGHQQLLHRGAHRLHPGAEGRGVSARPLTGRSGPRPAQPASVYLLLRRVVARHQLFQSHVAVIIHSGK